MNAMKSHLFACLVAGLVALPATAEQNIEKEKLQIVFLMGQSNMVGLAEIDTTRYLTEPAYVPPRDILTRRSDVYNWMDLYWQGMNTFKGPQKYKDQLEALVEENRESRRKWRQRVCGDHGSWQEEWGDKPEGSGRAVMNVYLEKKATEEGIFARMKAIIDSPHNEFPVEVAYQEIVDREQEIADELKLVRDHYLKGAKDSDFDALRDAMKEAGIPNLRDGNVEEQRAQIARLAQEHVHLPVSERVRIVAHGHVAGSEGEQNRYTTHGPLSVGYGAKITTIGPEYGVGIALERMVDAPILLVKCSWGNTALSGAWRPPSLDGVETPTEKARREAANERGAAQAKAEGREFKPKPPAEKSGELSYCWGMTLPLIERVLADPGRFHPDYDPEVGYEIGGMVWFQGYSDQGNPAYGEQLVELIKFMREKVDAPDMPFVAGTLGMAAYKHKALDGDVNRGMVEAARHPEMRGTVDVVNTAPYYPIELAMAHTVKDSTDKESEAHAEADAAIKQATSDRGFHYHGSAKCFLLMGDAMGRSLGNLMAGGEPHSNE